MSSATSTSPPTAIQRAESQQVWNIRAALDISPESLRLCRGINDLKEDGTRSRRDNGPCKNRIKAKEATEALQILDSLAKIPPEQVLHSTRLRDLAKLAHCTNRHRKERRANVNRLIAEWKAKITVFVVGMQVGNVTVPDVTSSLEMRVCGSSHTPTPSRVQGMRRRARTYVVNRCRRVRLEVSRSGNEIMAAGTSLLAAVRRKIRMPKRLEGPAIMIKNIHFNFGMFVLNSSNSDTPGLPAFKNLLKTIAATMWNWSAVRTGSAPLEVTTTE